MKDALLKKSRGTFRDLFFFHIFRQDDETLERTQEVVFALAKTFLFISSLLSMGLVFIAILLGQRHPIGSVFKVLDNFAVAATLALCLSVLIVGILKAGAFFKNKAKLVWCSFLLVFFSVLVIFILLAILVFEETFNHFAAF